MNSHRHITNVLENIVAEHIDIFPIGLSSGPPVDLPPMRIELKKDAKPIKVRLRNYSEPQKEFLDNFVFKLVEKGMAYANPTSAWAAAPLLVLKPGPSRFRFTVDLRPVNKYTVKHVYPMPILDIELHKLAESKC